MRSEVHFYELLDVIAGDLPLSIFVQHRSNGLHCQLLMLEAAVVLDHHVLAVWSAGKALRQGRGLNLPRFQFAEGKARCRHGTLPLVLGHMRLEELCSVLPAFRVLARVN